MLDDGRNPLLKRLKDTITSYKSKDTLEVMKSEHSIFIPIELIKQDKEETNDFIRFSRRVNNTKEWNCPVEADPINTGGVQGIEFVYTFSKETKFDSIIEEIDKELLK